MKAVLGESTRAHLFCGEFGRNQSQMQCYHNFFRQICHILGFILKIRQFGGLTEVENTQV